MAMANVTHLTKENELNKLLKQQKQFGFETEILFISLWDEMSQNLMEKIRKQYKNDPFDGSLYIIDTFNMPHSSVIFNTTKVPQYIKLSSDGIFIENYTPLIYNCLRLQ